VLNDPRLFVI